MTMWDGTDYMAMSNLVSKVDRRLFTPGGVDPDFPVPIGPNQAVPTTRMAYLLADALDCEGKTVLEIGTGSGFQAAVLAERCKSVVSIEIQPVVDVALKLPANVTLIAGDGGTHDTGEQFDAILVTFAFPAETERREFPRSWVKQLRPDGRLVIPLVDEKGICQITILGKDEYHDCLEFRSIIAYAPFTEMVSA